MKYHIALFLYKTVASLPIGIRRKLGSLIGRLVGKVPFRESKIATLQLKAFLPNNNEKTTASDVFSSLGETFFESMNLAPIIKNITQHVESPDDDLVREIGKFKRPAVCLAAHTGNWDLGGAYVINHLKVPCSSIGKMAQNGSFQDILSGNRASYGVTTIWRGENKEDSGVRTVVNKIKEQNSIVCAFVDQDTKVKSCMTPYFGLPVKTPTGLITLARRYDATIFSAFTVRYAPGKYRVHFELFDENLSVKEVASEFNLRLEKIVRQHPGQWAWVHKRWQSRENGRLSSNDYMKFLTQRIAETESKKAA